MKSVKILLSVALAVVGVVAMAQDFSDDAKYGKYGATPEERKDNIYLLNFSTRRSATRISRLLRGTSNNCWTSVPRLRRISMPRALR